MVTRIARTFGGPNVNWGVQHWLVAVVVAVLCRDLPVPERTRKEYETKQNKKKELGVRER